MRSCHVCIKARWQIVPSTVAVITLEGSQVRILGTQSKKNNPKSNLGFNYEHWLKTSVERRLIQK